MGLLLPLWLVGCLELFGKSDPVSTPHAPAPPEALAKTTAMQLPFQDPAVDLS